MLAAKASASFTARLSGAKARGAALRRCPPFVDVGVDADGQDVQLRLCPIRRSRELDRRARWQRGQQVAGVVGDHLDDVVARVERQLLLDGVSRPAARRPGRDRGRDAVDPPFDAADALAPILDAGADSGEIAHRLAAIGRRRDHYIRRRPAAEDLPRLMTLAASRTSPFGSPARASRTRSGLNSD